MLTKSRVLGKKTLYYQVVSAALAVRGLGRFSFHLLSPLNRLFPNALHALDALPLLVHLSALHDSLDDLTSIDVFEGVILDFPENAHFFDFQIWILFGRHEGRWAMVYGCRYTVRDIGKVGASGDKGR
jgi:hypothetical protein